MSKSFTGQFQENMAKMMVQASKNPLMQISQKMKADFGKRALSTAALSAILMNSFAGQAQAAWTDFLPSMETMSAAVKGAAGYASDAASAAWSMAPSKETLGSAASTVLNSMKEHPYMAGATLATALLGLGTYKFYQHLKNNRGDVQADPLIVPDVADKSSFFGTASSGDGFVDDKEGQGHKSLIPDSDSDDDHHPKRMHIDDSLLDEYQPNADLQAEEKLAYILAQKTIAERFDHEMLTKLAQTSKAIHEGVTHGMNMKSKAKISLSKMNDASFEDFQDPESFASKRIQQKSHVILSYGEASQQQITSLIRAMPNLQTLEFDAESFKGIAAKKSVTFVMNVLEALSDAQRQNLKELHLDFINKGLGTKGIQDLCQVLGGITNLTTLQLNLGNNNLTSESFEYLSETLLGMTNLTTLQLGLQNNEHIGAQGLQNLSNALAEMTDLKELNLNLSFNNALGSGVEFLSQTLAKMNSLTTLDLRLDSCKIKPRLIQALENMTKLKTLNLNLGRNTFEPQDAKLLSQALAKMTNLTKLNLNLRSTEAGEFIEVLSQTLAEMPKLETLGLNFPENRLGTLHINILSTNLVRMKNLKGLRLGFFFNHLESQDVQVLSQALQGMTKLTKLDLTFGNNNIGPDIAQTLSHDLANMNQLTTVSLALGIKEGESLVNLFRTKK